MLLKTKNFYLGQGVGQEDISRSSPALCFYYSKDLQAISTPLFCCILTVFVSCLELASLMGHKITIINTRVSSELRCWLYLKREPFRTSPIKEYGFCWVIKHCPNLPFLSRYHMQSFSSNQGRQMFVVNWSSEMMPAAPFDFDFSVISLFLFLTISNFSSCADNFLSCWYHFQVNDPALRPTGLYCNQLSSDLLKTEADGAQVSKTFLRQNSVGKILNGCLALPLRIFSERQ